MVVLFVLCFILQCLVFAVATRKTMNAIMNGNDSTFAII